MKASTQAIIGATLILLGVGVVALGAFEEESTVRYVEDLLERPLAHSTGTYTLLGMPEPPELPGPAGPQVNPDFINETRHDAVWTDADGRIRRTTHVIQVETTDGKSVWTYRNETRLAGVPGEPQVSTTNWTIHGPHAVFQVHGFPDASGHSQAVWVVYEGVFTSPIERKPSQFEGRVVASLGGVDMPREAVVYHADKVTAGCSSKFLPAEMQEEYDPDGDGQV